MADLAKLVEEISALTLIEAAELVKKLEDKLGVSAAAPVAMMAAAPVAVEAEPEEEQTEFTVILKDFGPKKIEVIKVVRQITNLGLKEAKELVEGVPSKVVEAVTKEVAEDTKAKLEAVGAVVELK
ncbi:MAG TPA: 50S ribosomal protein L7/L12 [Anaerolineae bacterium]|nr:50S ribosomal protein L7/L12 [Anaerolineae bacterium]HQI85450.1 50S ribosomal protein L7/L12 [Anaerolineae bacterium]